METLQQRMAVSALEQIKAFKKAHEDNTTAQTKYRTMALNLPVLILTDGLVQALVFVQARGDEAQKALLDHVAATIAWQNITGGAALVDHSRTAGLSEYMVLTRRVLAALVWYKRYAETVLDTDEQDGQTAVPVTGGANA